MILAPINHNVHIGRPYSGCQIGRTITHGMDVPETVAAAIE